MTLDARKAMDRLGTLAAVFFFAFMAYQLWGTHFVMAIVCVVCAVAVPYIATSARRAHDRLFGSRGDDK
jgi:uncharacterized membrane protein YhaH (DUF805 family)